MKYLNTYGHSQNFPDSMGNFKKTLVSFQKHWKVSLQARKFMETLKNLGTPGKVSKILWKLSRHSDEYLENPESFWIHKKLFRHSRKFTDILESLRRLGKYLDILDQYFLFEKWVNRRVFLSFCIRIGERVSRIKKCICKIVLGNIWINRKFRIFLHPGQAPGNLKYIYLNFCYNFSGCFWYKIN